MLEVTSLRTGYRGGPDVLRDATLTVDKHEIVSLIGLNGAGKSTLVRAIAGLLPIRGGTVRFEGNDVTGLTTDARTRLGMVLVPEGRELCAPMSVRENLSLGTVPLPRSVRRKQGAKNLELVEQLFPILHDKQNQSAGSLSGGQQQMVAIGRALMASPRLLLLDEPSLGLAPLLVEEIFEAIARLNEEGLSVLVVEQNAVTAMRYSDRAYHLELGEVSVADTKAQQRSLHTGGGGVEQGGDARALDLPQYARLGRDRARTKAKGAQP